MEIPRRRHDTGKHIQILESEYPKLCWKSSEFSIKNSHQLHSSLQDGECILLIFPSQHLAPFPAHGRCLVACFPNGQEGQREKQWPEEEANRRKSFREEDEVMRQSAHQLRQLRSFGTWGTVVSVQQWRGSGSQAAAGRGVRGRCGNGSCGGLHCTLLKLGVGRKKRHSGEQMVTVPEIMRAASTDAGKDRRPKERGAAEDEMLT